MISLTSIWLVARPEHILKVVFCQLGFDGFNRIAKSSVLLKDNIPIRGQTGYWEAIHNAVYPDI